MLRYKNNVACTLAATLTDSATTITLTPGDGAQLPVIASGTADTFLITATDKNGNKEIISICRRDSGADTLYIGTGTAHQASGNILGRAQESTTARAVTYTDDHSISIYPTAAPFEAAVKYSDAGELTSTTTEINQLASSGVSTADLVKLHAVTASAATLNAVVTTARTITAGTGLSGGGDLSSNRTIAIDTGGVDTTQLADGAVTEAKLDTYTAGDQFLIEGSSSIALTSSTTKTHEVQLDKGGTLRIKFTLIAAGASGSTVGRIYRNGSAVGTTRTLSAPGGAGIDTQTYSQDISGWSAGDLVQLYASTTASYGGSAGDFKLYCGNWYALVDMML